MTELQTKNLQVQENNQGSPANLISLIEDLQDALYSTKDLAKDSTKGDSVFQKLRSPEFSSIVSLLKSQDASLDLESLSAEKALDRRKFKKTLDELRKTVTNLPTLRVKVAQAKLPESSWTNIFNWLKTNLMDDKMFLLDIEEDPVLLGGIVIYWRGKVIDLSLQHFMSEFFVKEVPHVSR